MLQKYPVPFTLRIEGQVVCKRRAQNPKLACLPNTDFRTPAVG